MKIAEVVTDEIYNDIYIYKLESMLENDSLKRISLYPNYIKILSLAVKANVIEIAKLLVSNGVNPKRKKLDGTPNTTNIREKRILQEIFNKYKKEIQTKL